MTLKQERMSERIREILSELVLVSVSDPRLFGLSVTDVEVDREIRVARVYVHAIGEGERKDEIMEALESAKGFLRREVGARVRLRHTPELRFTWDTSLEHANRINTLLDSLDIPPDPDELDEMDDGD